MSLKQRVNRLKREVTALEEDQRPVVALVSGDPLVHQLLGRSLSSEREAMIGSEVFEALDDETTKAFHRRLCAIARERNAGLDRGIIVVSIGDDEPQPVCRYNLDGTLITVN